MDSLRENFNEDDSFNNDESGRLGSQQQQATKPPKKKFMLRKRIEEDIKNAKSYSTVNGKLIQTQPIKKSFQSVARRASQISKLSMPVPSNSQSGLVDTKQRDTVFSQKSLGNAGDSRLLHDTKSQSAAVAAAAAALDPVYTPVYNGPQVELERKDVSFIVDTGKVAFDSVNVTNNGSASIYYEWKRIESARTYSTTLNDPEEKFFCHHEQNVIRPGEEKKFVFAFMSKVTGIFYEEWELQCEPPTTRPIPRLKLTGNSIDVDELKEWRSDFDDQSLQHHVQKAMHEIVGDILDGVRTPTPPLPDLEDESVAQREFESKNQAMHIWYNPLVMKWWRALESDLYAELKLEPEHQYWDLDLAYIRQLIEMVEDEENKAFYQGRFANYVELNSKRPPERSELFASVSDLIWRVASNMPVLADKVREEVGMWESVFRPPLDERDFTEAETKQMEEEKAKIKAEWIKKTKKKKWTDDDDKKMNEDYVAALSTRVSNEIYTFFDGIEEKDAYNRAAQTIATRETPNLHFFQQLLRKKPLKELEFDGKRVLLRVHLKLSSAPDAIEKRNAHIARLIQEREDEIKRIEEEKALLEKQAKEKKKVAKRPAPAPAAAVGGKKGKQPVVVEEEKPKEKVLDTSFLDEDNLSDIVENLKYLLERQAKLVILMVSYDEPCGEYRFTSSIKFFVEYLKKRIEQQVIVFNESTDHGISIDNFEEKIETESFQDNSVLVLENAFFSPAEIGFRQDPLNNNPIETQLGSSLPSGSAAAGLTSIPSAAAGANSQHNKQIETSLVKYTLEDKQEYIQMLQQYAPCFVVEDKVNIASRLTSLVNVDYEHHVLGLRTTEDIQQTAHIVSFANPRFLALIGGDLSPSKLLAIDTLANFASHIQLFGPLGIKFLFVQQDLIQEEKDRAAAAAAALAKAEEKPVEVVAAPVKGGKAAPPAAAAAAAAQQAAALLASQTASIPVIPTAETALLNTLPHLQQFKPSAIEKQAIIATLKSLKTKDAQLIVPVDFVIAQDILVEGADKFSPAWLEKVLPTASNYPPILEDSAGEAAANDFASRRVSATGSQNQQQLEGSLAAGNTQFQEDEQEPSQMQYDDEQDYDSDGQIRKKNYNDIPDDEEKAEKAPAFDYGAAFPAGYTVVDFGELSLLNLRNALRKCRKLAWFDSLALRLHANASNQSAAWTLQRIQDKKSKRLNASGQSANDLVAFLSGGTLESHLNAFPLQDLSPPQVIPNAGEEDGENGELGGGAGGNANLDEDGVDLDDKAEAQDENKSVVSGMTAVTKQRISAVKVLADFFSKDLDFVLKILEAKHQPSLAAVHSYVEKTSSELSLDLSFLDL